MPDTMKPKGIGLSLRALAGKMAHASALTSRAVAST